MIRDHTVARPRPHAPAADATPDARPLVSILVPVRNRRETLARALRSVAEQDYAPLEVIIVDDASVEDIADIAADFSPLKPIVKRLETSKGVAAARNAGL